MEQVTGVALGLGLLLGMFLRVPALFIAATFSIPVGITSGPWAGFAFLTILSVAYLVGAWGATVMRREDQRHAHRVFALFPVTLIDGRKAWFCWVWRQWWEDPRATWSSDESFWQYAVALSHLQPPSNACQE